MIITNQKELISAIDSIKEYLEKPVENQKLSTKSAMTIDEQKLIFEEINKGNDVECACLMGWYPVNPSNHIFDFEHNVYRKIENDKD